jgi:hypothetical protein
MNNYNKLLVFQGTFDEIVNHIKKLYTDVSTNINGIILLNNYKYYAIENSEYYEYITYLQKHLTGDYEFYKGPMYDSIPIENGFFKKNQIYKIKFNNDDKIITKII